MYVVEYAGSSSKSKYEMPSNLLLVITHDLPGAGGSKGDTFRVPNFDALVYVYHFDVGEIFFCEGFEDGDFGVYPGDVIFNRIGGIPPHILPISLQYK